MENLSIEPKISNNNEFVTTKEFEALKARHEKEISLWMGYDERVKQWTSQVVNIIHNLKQEVVVKQGLELELKRCQNLVSSKDEEIARLRDHIARIKTQPKGILSSLFR